MRRLALLIVTLLGAQLPLCVFAEGRAGASHHTTAGAGAHHAHPAGPPADGHGPVAPHQQSCIEHCAQQTQGLPGHAESLDIRPPQPLVLAAGPVLAGLGMRLHRSAEALRDRSPPDPDLLATILRL